MNVPGNAKVRKFLDKLSSSSYGKRLNLPSIAVMGDTSCGKSTVLSLLSTIEIPSGSDLTTRCPIRITMIQSHVRKATVAVEWKQKTRKQEGRRRRMAYDDEEEDEDEEDEDGLYERNPPEFVTLCFGEDDDDDSSSNSSDNNSNTKQGDSKNKGSSWKTLIPNAIRKAQDHIMKHVQKEVAHDIVTVRIQGPDCRDLTLLDLPGMVRTHAQNETSDLIHDTRSIMEQYLDNDQCIILAILPANVDFHNVQILSDARIVDPNTTRTLPVLTKPDLIDPGAEHMVLKLLMGHTIDFRLGFHMIKGRGQAATDQGLSLFQAMDTESHYFDTNSPWKDVQDRSLFGTEQLRIKLGELQMNMARDSIPRLVNDLLAERDQLNHSLSKLPRPLTSSTDKRHYYHTHVQSFLRTLKQLLNGKITPASSSSSSSRRLPSSSSSSPLTNGNDHTITDPPPPSPSARLHDACANFKAAILSGKLANITAITVGTNVLVSVKEHPPHLQQQQQQHQQQQQQAQQTIPSYPQSSPSMSSSSTPPPPILHASALTVGPILDHRKTAIRGKVVVLLDGYACVDFVDEDDKSSPILFRSHDHTFSHHLNVDEGVVIKKSSKYYVSSGDGTFDELRPIPLDEIRSDPSWLKELISRNRSDHLSCFLPPAVFNRAVADFIEEEWEPHCYDLVRAAEDLLKSTIASALKMTTTTTATTTTTTKHAVNDYHDTSISSTLLSNKNNLSNSATRTISTPSTTHNNTNTTTVRFPKLELLLQRKCDSVLRTMIESALIDVQKHLQIEKFPYTQDPTLFQSIAIKRYDRMESDLHLAFSGYSDYADAMIDKSTISALLSEVIDRHKQKSLEDHMAEDMESLLDAYGKVVVRRIVDKTPMICWNVFRNIVNEIQDSLLLLLDEDNDDNDENTEDNNNDDDDDVMRTTTRSTKLLETMQEDAEKLTRRFDLLTKKRKELDQVMMTLEDLLAN